MPVQDTFSQYFEDDHVESKMWWKGHTCRVWSEFVIIPKPLLSWVRNLFMLDLFHGSVWQWICFIYSTKIKYISRTKCVTSSIKCHVFCCVLTLLDSSYCIDTFQLTIRHTKSPCFKPAWILIYMWCNRLNSRIIISWHLWQGAPWCNL